ncbi:HAD family hydrolase [Pseudomonas sp. ZM23]|uniref:HAD family hydrolase n=1 Tax=Pseudomonas triclosanedens TaxID=2961893 RepID=A0ABY6ZY53_9PSED|nr:HAD family hydrolase [Pseudomonas triclosanedens]MCP8462705.1 HAD family hydrolase [Pseudomonas triclosanedens]MCP8468324.1 HAD family hydrolase [Pseudomonas triclosanedens]MCP8475083.1 HAD family hydrolase [Pseudomonas triclosanedens]WAI49892.1 HAD family hydrolase [Pseudomonas triclosanedens]
MDEPIEAVIFDCDGTLVDSERLSAGLIVTLLGERNVRTSLEAILSIYRGERFQDVVERLGQLYPGIAPAQFLAEYRQRSLPWLRAHLKPMPGAVELVRRLRVAKCVASNGPRDKIETSLSCAGLLDDFRGQVISAYEVGAWKPDPKLILHAARSLGVAPQRCLVVDDSLPGLRAGLDAGARAIGFGEVDFASLGLEIARVRDMAELGRLLGDLELLAPPSAR